MPCSVTSQISSIFGSFMSSRRGVAKGLAVMRFAGYGSTHGQQACDCGLTYLWTMSSVARFGIPSDFKNTALMEGQQRQSMPNP